MPLIRHFSASTVTTCASLHAWVGFKSRVIPVGCHHWLPLAEPLQQESFIAGCMPGCWTGPKQACWVGKVQGDLPQQQWIQLIQHTAALFVIPACRDACVGTGLQMTRQQRFESSTELLSTACCHHWTKSSCMQTIAWFWIGIGAKQAFSTAYLSLLPTCAL